MQSDASPDLLYTMPLDDSGCKDAIVYCASLESRKLLWYSEKDASILQELA
jgi:hypothetical protein